MRFYLSAACQAPFRRDRYKEMLPIQSERIDADMMDDRVNGIRITLISGAYPIFNQ